jgi:tetraacyldisaccharide-1-P 4'-kinase
METVKGDFVVTTEKDAVRLESVKLPDGLPGERFLTVLIEAVIVRGEERLSEILNEKIDRLIA